MNAVGDLVISLYPITRSPDHLMHLIHSGRGDLPQMFENKESLRYPIEEVEYQPDPASLAGFIAGMSERVDELLAAADWRPME
ncbi:MAG TPA: hypothetical protein VJT08_14180 [Terriglobales bacterium]|nr:hypothetical protein [Terriglobales bacterium]